MTTAKTRALRRSAIWDSTVWQRHAAYWPVRAHAAPFVAHAEFPSVEQIDSALASASGVRFRTQAPARRRVRGAGPLPPAQSYDASIVEHGVVPTREGSWHDLMNALVWAAFPRTKRALHAQQHAFIGEERRLGHPGRRLPAHDALAILDEGGVCVVAEDAYAEGLASTQDVERALTEGRARAFVFGHAIYETLALGGPWPLVRGVVLARATLRAGANAAHLAAAEDDAALLAAADVALARMLDAGRGPRGPKDLVCLPPAIVAAHLA